MLSSGLAGSRLVPRSSTTFTNVTVFGISWPIPTAPVLDTTWLRQPDSHHVIAWKRSAGTPYALAQYWKRGRSRKRSGDATSRFGSPRPPLAKPVTTGGGGSDPGTTSFVPITTMFGFFSLFAAASAATVVPN